MTFVEMFRDSVEQSFPDHQVTWTGETSCMIGATPFSIQGVEAVEDKPEEEQRKLLAFLIESANGAVKSTDEVN